MTFLGRHGSNMSRVPVTWSLRQRYPAEGGFLLVLGHDGLGGGGLSGECPAWIPVMPAVVMSLTPHSLLKALS